MSPCLSCAEMQEYLAEEAAKGHDFLRILYGDGSPAAGSHVHLDWGKIQWFFGLPLTTEDEKLADERKAFRIKEGLEVPTLVTLEDSLAICGHASRPRG